MLEDILYFIYFDMVGVVNMVDVFIKEVMFRIVVVCGIIFM